MPSSRVSHSVTPSASLVRVTSRRLITPSLGGKADIEAKLLTKDEARRIAANIGVAQS
jgi:hypothetical protein